MAIVASTADARSRAANATSDDVTVALTRYATPDDPTYAFEPPGTPGSDEDSLFCVHCHRTITADWYASPHRTSASDAAVQAVYRGMDAMPSVEAATGGTGACADCHAPGIGEPGHALGDATGTALDAGVLCDVCHKVEHIALDAPAGTGGRLGFLRPSEVNTTPGQGPRVPLTFGPWSDVPNPVMGGVGRELFHDGSLCAGCHQLEQAVLVDTPIDTARWPADTLPIQTTTDEWLASPYGEKIACPACHMPPDPSVGNGADLGNEFDLVPGIAGGWYRPPGSVRRHQWVGPSTPSSGMLQLAAALSVSATVEGDVLTATVTTTNVGAGHALPTGEPDRSVLLLVDATCGGVPLEPTGGDAVPDFGGALAMQVRGDDWSTWPDALPGDVVRVVNRIGWRDLPGTGPFGDFTFDAAEKGLPDDTIAGYSTVVSIDPVTFDRPLPDGDVAYLDDGATLPADGDPLRAYAGAPGLAFARVLVGADGARQVPHFLAVDVASDDRLLPQQGVTTTHTFRATCAAPQVHAMLVYRQEPLSLSQDYGWDTRAVVMAEVTR